MNDIRVTYSGLIAFVVKLVGVITGIVFTIIVTRQLPQEEFGLWTLLGSLISYVIVYEPIISFWVSRQIARGEDVGKTAILSSGIFSLISTLAFVVIAFFVSETIDSQFYVLVLGMMLVPLSFVSNTLAGINLGHKPQATSFGFLFFEVFKIPTALMLVYFLDLGVVGAIIATMVAFVIKVIIQFYFAKPKLTGIINFNQIRNWIKFSWLPIYGIIPGFIFTLDVLIFTTFTKSVEGLAYYGAAMAIGNIVTHAGMITQGLYPKLLADGRIHFINNNFSKLLYFSLPLLTIAILFSKSGLQVLNPIYEDAYFIVIIYSIRSFFFVITNTFYKVLQGLEKVDETQITSSSHLIKSKLFLVPTLKFFNYGLYVISLVIMLIVLIDHELSDIELITWWVALNLIIQICFAVIAGIICYKKTHYTISLKDLIKYSLGALVILFVFLVSSDYILIYDPSIFIFLPRVAIEALICVLSYMGFTWLIDKKTRTFFRSILSEFVSKT